VKPASGGRSTAWRRCVPETAASPPFSPLNLVIERNKPGDTDIIAESLARFAGGVRTG